MNASHIAGMAYESEDFSNNWYYRFAKHPYYGSYGLNSGIMLMNLTRMRQFGWIEKLEPTLIKYKNKIVWGDQDIINILFHYNTGMSPIFNRLLFVINYKTNIYIDKLYLFGCNWNYRPDHCVYTSTCKMAEREGIKIVHGNRGAFLHNKQAAFKALFFAFQQYNFERQTFGDLVEQFQNQLSSIGNDSNCAKVLSHLF